MQRLIAIIFAFVALTGCQTTQQNDNSANSCIAGAPVCDDVDRDKLGPGLRFEFDKFMKKKQVNVKQSNDGQTEIPNYSQDITKAAVSIIGACTGWQTGIVERSNIMDAAKQIYAKQGFDPNNVDWARAVEVARELDKQQGLGCIN